MLELKAKYIKGSREHMGVISKKKKKEKKKETIATEGQIIVKTRHNYVTIRTTFLFTFLLPKPHVSPRNFTKIRISLVIWHESILGL